MDANTEVSGNQAFQFGGAGQGQLRLTETNGVTSVLANTDGDSAVELRITLRDGSVRAADYTEDDFVL